MTADTDALIDPEYRPKWQNRRKVIFGSLLFSAFIITACTAGWLFYELEINAPLSAVLVSLVGMSTVIISVYVFNARIEDISLAQMFKR